MLRIHLECYDIKRVQNFVQSSLLLLLDRNSYKVASVCTFAKARLGYFKINFNFFVGLL